MIYRQTGNRYIPRSNCTALQTSTTNLHFLNRNVYQKNLYLIFSSNRAAVVQCHEPKLLMKSSCKCESGVKCSGMCVCSYRGAGITPARLVWVNSSCCWRSLWCSAASNQRCSRSFPPNSARWLQWRRTVSTLAPKLLSTLLPKCSPEDTTTWVQTTIQLWKQVRFEHFFRGNYLMVLFHCVARLGSVRFRTVRHGSVRLGLCFHCSLVPL